MEHYRLGSMMAILSRSFCNADKVEHTDEIRDIFMNEVARIREAEADFAMCTAKEFTANHEEVIRLVNRIKESL